VSGGARARYPEEMLFTDAWVRFRKWFNDPGSREQRLDIVLSLLVGIVVGLVIVSFILLTGRLAARMYPPGDSPVRRVLIPVIGALITGYLLYRYFPEARGSGIPQTKFALFVRDGHISLRTVIGKFICCSASLASGIALGREGPSVHIGAGIASVLARRSGLAAERVRSLIPVGCSAAVAAAFNTPIAGVLFALEEIMGNLHAPVLGAVVISSATSWMVLHLILGNEPLFHVPEYQLVHPMEFLIYAVLGVVGGLASVAFVKLLLRIRLWFRALPAHTVWIQPTAGGLVVGLLGWYSPEVLGVGYEFVERVLWGDLALKTVATLALLKIIATAAAYSSGNAGGIFGPSLFMGAMFGGTVGSIAHWLFPDWTANPGAYALVGMGTAFAGIVRTPLTSVIMIFEMTRDYSIIVPLMISNLISFFVSYRLQPKPIYEALAHQEGITLPGEELRGHAGRVPLSTVMRSAYVQPEMPVSEAAERAAGLKSLPVVDGGRVVGTVHTADLERAPPEGLVRPVMHELQPRAVVYPDQSLSTALECMGNIGVDAVPVVSRADGRTYLGTVTLADTLAAYGLRESERP
jgi:chloride channel protein, CIC family